MFVAISTSIHTYLSVRVFLIAIVAIPALFLYTKNTATASAACIAIVSVGLVVTFLKKTVPAKRPADALVHEKSDAFPSGHAAGAACIATTLCVGFVPITPFLYMYVFFAALFVGVIAGSRLILRVHTPFQVVAGVLIGTVIPFLVFALL